MFNKKTSRAKAVDETPVIPTFLRPKARLSSCMGRNINIEGNRMLTIRYEHQSQFNNTSNLVPHKLASHRSSSEPILLEKLMRHHDCCLDGNPSSHLATKLKAPIKQCNAATSSNQAVPRGSKPAIYCRPQTQRWLKAFLI